VDGKRESGKALSARVVVSDSDVREGGWIAVDLAAYEGVASAAASFARPQATQEPPWRSAGAADEKALIKARLVAWAERLRNREERGPEEAASSGRRVAATPPAIRRIPALDIVTLDRRSIRLRKAPAARLLAAPVEPTEILPPPPKPRRFSSRRARFLLLGMAAAYLVTGLVHSFARSKSPRAIVVPATADGRSVIT
jgi:hypothetical protein